MTTELDPSAPGPGPDLSPARLGTLEALVLGGSAGAWPALQTILGGLGPDFPLPILVVLHVDRIAGMQLAGTLGLFTRLPVIEALDKMPALPGRVHTAPGDYHLLVERGGKLALDADEAEHFCRPAINPTFRAAADAWGAGLLAVLLSGANEDGATGLRTVVRRGGLALVQDPAEAQFPLMPAAALATGVGIPLTTARIAALVAAIPDAKRAALEPPVGADTGLDARA